MGNLCCCFEIRAQKASESIKKLLMSKSSEIKMLNEQWQRMPYEAKTKIMEIMQKRKLKFEDLIIDIEKKEELISELRKEKVELEENIELKRKESVELKDEVAELKDQVAGLKSAVETLTQLVNVRAIVEKEDQNDDRCSVAKVGN